MIDDRTVHVRVAEGVKKGDLIFSDKHVHEELRYGKEKFDVRVDVSDPSHLR